MFQLFFENLKDIYLDIAPYLFLGLAFSGFLHIIFKKDFIAKHLGKNNIASVLKASVLGVPLPLCSCGVIPTALYLRKQKASKGATLSFLISTPQTGVDSIIATYGMMGPVFAIFRPIAAFFSGIIGGVAANALLKKDDSAGDQNSIKSRTNNQAHDCSSCTVTPVEPKNLPQKIYVGMKYAFSEFLDDISLQLVVGIILAAVISFAIPDEFFVKYGGNGLPGMLMMMLFAIPLYVCATASIPIAVSLILKGISPGAALVFLITGPATNIATITMISRALGRKTIVIYLSVIAIMAVLSGYLLNWIFSITGYEQMMSNLHQHHGSNVILTLSTILFSVFLLLSLYRKIKARFFTTDYSPKEIITMKNIKRYHVQGMTCNHCVAHVKSAIDDVLGVDSSSVLLNEKLAEVSGDSDPQEIISAITKAGYKAELIE